ncbi:MAG: LCP family protein [Clostridiales bacterium]|nr:LCP family protein [Clostridiales bacterium]
MDHNNNEEPRSRRNPRLRSTSEPTTPKSDGIGPTGSNFRALDRATERRTDSVKHADFTRRADSARNADSMGRIGLTPRQERDLARRKKRRRIIAMIIAECFALVFIFGYAYVLRTYNTIQRPQFEAENIKNNDLAVETVEKMKGYWTIAIFGVDARYGQLEKDTLSDVNIICNINQDTGEIKLVSVYRDTYLNISKGGSYNKINQAYFVGGAEQAVSALNRNLDLDITDFVTFNWKAVAEGINILGGVDIELSKAEFYYINSFITETVKVTGIASTQLKSAGMNHLDGVQAVAYGRLRLMDTDYARTERQRKVIAQAFEKAKSADFATLNNVVVTVFPDIATSVDLMDMVRCAKNITKYYLSDTTGFPQARGDANMGSKGACVIPQTLETNVIKLHEFLFGDEDYTVSDTVKTISAKIAADSGMYKEGTYVDHVSTDGGVIQKNTTSTKAASDDDDEDDDDDDNGASKSAADDEDDDDDEDAYITIYVLDADGKKVKKTIKMSKDEDGEYIEPETNADGLAVDWSLDEDGKLVNEETDEDGEIVLHFRPTAPTGDDDEEDEDESDEEEETDEDGNPLKTITGSSRPGVTAPTAATTATETTSGTGVSSGPGSSSSTTSATTPTSSSVSSSPGSSTSPTAVSSSTSTGVSSGPGASSSTSSSGSTSSSSSSSSSGSSTSITPTAASGTSTGGVVSAPGQ